MERHIVGNNSQNKEENVTESEVKDDSADREKNDPYAHMFAEWDLLPPQVGIRRIRRKAR